MADPKKKRTPIPWEKRREIAKKAKAQSGVYGSRGRKTKVRGQQGEKETLGAKDFSETGVGRGLRNIKGKITGKRVLKKVGRGSGQGVEDRSKRPRKSATTSTAAFGSDPESQTVVRDGNLVKELVSGGRVREDLSKRSGAESKTAKGLESKGTKAAGQVGHSEGAKPWTRESRADVEKFPEYEQNKEAAKKALYVSGSRSKTQIAQGLKQEDLKRTYEGRYGQKRGSRKLKKFYKSKMKEDYRAGEEAKAGGKMPKEEIKSKSKMSNSKYYKRSGKIKTRPSRKTRF